MERKRIDQNAVMGASGVNGHTYRDEEVRFGRVEENELYGSLHLLERRL